MEIEGNQKLKKGDVVILGDMWTCVGTSMEVLQRRWIVFSESGDSSTGYNVYNIRYKSKKTGKWGAATYWSGFLEKIGAVTEIPKLGTSDPWPVIERWKSKEKEVIKC